MLSTQSIVWCIENCMAFVHGAQAALEYSALMEYIGDLEERLTKYALDEALGSPVVLDSKSEVDSADGAGSQPRQ